MSSPILIQDDYAPAGAVYERRRAVHVLKTWPEYFNDVAQRRKTAEFRWDNRGYDVGDRLLLREFRPDTAHYSGRMVIADVTHVVRANGVLSYGIPEGYSMLSIHVYGEYNMLGDPAAVPGQIIDWVRQSEGLS